MSVCLSVCRASTDLYFKIVVPSGRICLDSLPPLPHLLPYPLLLPNQTCRPFLGPSSLPPSFLLFLPLSAVVRRHFCLDDLLFSRSCAVAMERRRFSPLSATVYLSRGNGGTYFISILHNASRFLSCLQVLWVKVYVEC